MELNGVTFFFDLRKTYDIAWRQRIIDLKMKKRILLHKPKNDKFLGLWSNILFSLGVLWVTALSIQTWKHTVWLNSSGKHYFTEQFSLLHATLISSYQIYLIWSASDELLTGCWYFAVFGPARRISVAKHVLQLIFGKFEE